MGKYDVPVWVRSGSIEKIVTGTTVHYQARTDFHDGEDMVVTATRKPGRIFSRYEASWRLERHDTGDLVREYPLTASMRRVYKALETRFERPEDI